MSKGCGARSSARRRGISALCGLVWLTGCTSVLAGICEELSPASANVTGYGTDYLPRIDVHDGRGPAEACAWSLPAGRPATIAFPLHAYNLQGEMSGARFRIVASARIVGFTAGPDLLETGMREPWSDGTHWYLDVDLGSTGVCGPALLGEVRVAIDEGLSTCFVDVTGYEGETSPVVEYSPRVTLPAIAPRHGGYAGQTDLYHCQPPLCQEPNRGVSGFAPLQSGGLVIELGWTAGSGNFTMIRYREDGIHPTSIFDGRLLTLMPTVEGETYATIHDDPQVVQYWYTAFSVTMSGEEIVLGSQLECSSFTTATVDESVPVESATWGALKSMFR